jgi:hypothetical protein
MSTLEILVTARALLARPDGWCQGTYALNERKYSVSPTDPEACSWCAWGALIAAGDRPDGDTAYDALRRALPSKLLPSISMFNDTAASVVNILEVYDRAIAELSQEKNQCPST